MTKIGFKKLQLGKLVIENPIIAAPLAGISDKGYRRVLKENGVPLVFTEMVSAKALIHNNKKTKNITYITGEDHPIGMQIFGRNPYEVGEGAKYLESIGGDIIDFNIGCPAPKIVKNMEGSALLKEPSLALKILEKLVESTSLPVTLKIRKGFTKGEHDAEKIILELENIGVKAVFIHGRLREEYYSGQADWEYIKKIKEKIKIPVIGNGDINSPEKAKEFLELTKCDGMLIGRGFLGNPLLFFQIEKYLTIGRYKKITFEEKLYWAMRQLQYTIADKGEVLGVKEMRKHFSWYLKGIRDSAKYKNNINSVKSLKEIEEIVSKIIYNNKLNVI